jgi:hypothetical protein
MKIAITLPIRINLLIISSLIFLFIGNYPALHANSPLPSQKTYRLHDDIYHNNIRTVQLRRTDHEMTLPVINFHSGERLHLSFDDLDADVKGYRYTVLHCDAHWNLSDLWPSDYITGFTDDMIESYRTSFNTIQAYTHYELIFPTQNLQFTLPGNYLLVVYLGNNPDNVAFTRRFSVVDSKVNIAGRVRMPPTSPERRKKHEIGFTVESNHVRISDPFRNLKVVVRQNHRWDNELRLQPHQVRGDVLDFNFMDESNTFYAGNEFRPLDLRALHSRAAGVQLIERDRDGYHVYLWPMQRRTFNAYIHEQDLNGRFTIMTDDNFDPAVNAEYVNVYFALLMENPIPNAQVFVAGALADWQFRDDNRMQYSLERPAYEATMLLKQGFYNFHFALLSRGELSADAGFFEGNHADTGNEYTIYVYYRFPGSRFDSLIGVKTIDSRDFL